MAGVGPAMRLVPSTLHPTCVDSALTKTYILNKSFWHRANVFLAIKEPDNLLTVDDGDDLFRGSQSRSHRSVNGSPVSCNVGMFSREEQRVCDRFCHLLRGIEPALRHIAVGAKRESVMSPVMRVTTFQQALNPLPPQPENSS